MFRLAAFLCLFLHYFIFAIATDTNHDSTSSLYYPENKNLLAKPDPTAAAVYFPFKGGDTASLIIQQAGDSAVDFSYYFDSQLSDGACLAFTLIPDDTLFSKKFKCVNSQLTCEGCLEPTRACYHTLVNKTCTAGIGVSTGCHDGRFSSYNGDLASYTTQKRLLVTQETIKGVSLTPRFGVVGLNGRIIVGILNYRNNKPPQAMCAFVMPGVGTYGNFSLAPSSDAQETRSVSLLTGLSLLISAILSLIF
ncbi:hypothetical protein J3Q64DRAFT_1825941 [Phycomyces blakesleeanus]|uniref:Uncharacterized protein n=2 Tax=Phycomyces blakesleeanus TaxID=4837 RepID=A0A167Q266_PHYB8|nr:hypothetical protein PHYBLDRAFT_164026 [Phycomyces blakesleeanus NRRL 1555(-)]OAD78929.1 hypothetical protein PHYBLDRAFT_164026 [Phycomyces blakesleeanus NRRL 1555(-)]|eukprot:XP_018296969.1 hypothetical protein PHYBLDRAFT_164026 [Phycomyces blakesleeanus NRRL 1555(-)]